VLPGEYEVYDSIRPRRSVKIRAHGKPHSVILDGLYRLPM